MPRADCPRDHLPPFLVQDDDLAISPLGSKAGLVTRCRRKDGSYPMKAAIFDGHDEAQSVP
jgi:hypothetical protein